MVTSGCRRGLHDSRGAVTKVTAAGGVQLAPWHFLYCGRCRRQESRGRPWARNRAFTTGSRRLPRGSGGSCTGGSSWKAGHRGGFAGDDRRSGRSRPPPRGEAAGGAARGCRPRCRRGDGSCQSSGRRSEPLADRRQVLGSARSAGQTTEQVEESRDSTPASGLVSFSNRNFTGVRGQGENPPPGPRAVRPVRGRRGVSFEGRRGPQAGVSASRRAGEGAMSPSQHETSAAASCRGQSWPEDFVDARFVEVAEGHQQPVGAGVAPGGEGNMAGCSTAVGLGRGGVGGEGRRAARPDAGATSAQWASARGEASRGWVGLRCSSWGRGGRKLGHGVGVVRVQVGAAGGRGSSRWAGGLAARVSGARCPARCRRRCRPRGPCR